MQLVAILRPYLAFAQIAAFAILLWRLFGTGLYKTYRFFCIFLLYELLRLAAVGFLDSSTRFYLNFYFFSQPLTWFLYLLVTLELYERSLKDYVGLATLGRRVLTIALTLSAVVAVGTIAIDIRHHQGLDQRLAMYAIIERVVLVSMLVFLFTLTVFLGYFPVPTNPNTKLHVRVFAIYFLSEASSIVLLSIVPPEFRAPINLSAQLVATICLIAWVALLTRKGEESARRTRQRSDSDLEAKLMAQLNAINETLIGSPKR